ncbi:cytochrome P450 [Polychaeton citri CBS 116435]|uniref:Cytochrome P450 n=1 Tax=Polychaeton citri CBS 116435 TaxID=1314669 RepID=A0A9P4URT1_9PEZI|nr:cytochrome P450 [Polychaeton citri CBS 116435]
MRMKGLPGPPHSYLFGHLRLFLKLSRRMPKGAHLHAMPNLVKQEYPELGAYFYLDPWPIAHQMLVVSDAEMMNQFTVQRSLPKHPVTNGLIQWLGGPGNMVTSEGAKWKKWRSAFSPCFSASHLMSLVPAIVDECVTFCDTLTEKAKKKELFRIERAATKLTVDVIGKVTLNTSFNTQKGQNPLVESISATVAWLSVGGLLGTLAFLDLRQPVMLRYHTWKMNTYVGNLLEECFATRHSRGRSKAVVDLALDAFLKEEAKGTAAEAKKLDPEFREAAISNIKVFVVAGHDTTSSLIVYSYYHLAKNPSILARVRDELNEVFGSDPSAIEAQLHTDPHLLNKLHYTLAVIREVLRFRSPASTVRLGQKDFFLRDPLSNAVLPTEDFMLWPAPPAMHMSPRYWPDPYVFDPNRHLSARSTGVSGQDETVRNKTKDFWIAFSKGPRNCIGQELAVLEVKIVLAMTLRRFDFIPAFDEVNKLRGDGTGYPSETQGPFELFGDEAYQVFLGTTKPREGMPMRLKLREQ